MSFTITLYVNDSPDNSVTKQITTVMSATGSLKKETSILSPVIVIDTTGVTQSDLFNCNYMYIPEFGRYYFVTDIRSIRNNLVEISAKVDVLTTYATEIRGLTAIIRRQANNWNLYVDDGVFKAYQNPIIVTKSFPSGFSGQSLILAVAGS